MFVSIISALGNEIASMKSSQLDTVPLAKWNDGFVKHAKKKVGHTNQPKIVHHDLKQSKISSGALITIEDVKRKQQEVERLKNALSKFEHVVKTKECVAKANVPQEHDDKENQHHTHDETIHEKLTRLNEMIKKEWENIGKSKRKQESHKDRNLGTFSGEEGENNDGSNKEIPKNRPLYEAITYEPVIPHSVRYCNNGHYAHKSNIEFKRDQDIQQTSSPGEYRMSQAEQHHPQTNTKVNLPMKNSALNKDEIQNYNAIDQTVQEQSSRHQPLDKNGANKQVESDTEGGQPCSCSKNIKKYMTNNQNEDISNSAVPAMIHTIIPPMRGNWKETDNLYRGIDRRDQR